MTFARASALGWGFNEKLLSSQITLIDQNLEYALDGLEGGSYAPSPPIDIGGDGLIISTNFVMSGSGGADFYGSFFITGAGGIETGGGVPALFNGTATFSVMPDFAAGVEVSAGNLDVADDVLVGGTLFVGGTSTLAAVTGVSFSTPGSGVVATASALTTDAATTTTLNGLAIVAGGASLTSVLAPTGTGRVRCRPPVTLSDSNVVIGINDGDTFLVPALGAERTLTMSTTGAGEGDRIHFNAILNTTANALNWGGSGGYYLFNQSAGIVFLDLLFTSGGWIVDDYTVHA